MASFSQLAFGDAEHAALLPGDEDAARGLAVSWPRYPLSIVDVGALDRAAGEPFGGFDNGTECMAIIRVAGHRPWRAGRTDRPARGHCW